MAINGGGDDAEEEERDLVKACLKVSIPALKTSSGHDLLDIVVDILITENEDVILVGKWRSQYYPTLSCPAFKMWWSNLCVISLGNVGNGFDVEVTGLLGFADQMGSSCTGKRLHESDTT